jgi:hypothetical protein
MLIHKPLLRLSDGSHYREVRFYYLQRCEGSGQWACQYLAGEGWVDLIYPDLSLLGICRLHTSLQFLSHVCCLFQLPKSRQMKWASVKP